MRIRAGFEISYWCPAPTAMMLLLNVHPSREQDLEAPEAFSIDPAVPYRHHIDDFGNRSTRLLAPAGQITFRNDFIIRDSGLPDPVSPDAVQWPVDELPDEAMPFLLGSRYCETDRMSALAWSLFGGIEPGWGRVQAIVDYAHQRIGFGYQHARPTKTAHDAHDEGLGVCRDYAHLAITLCRCMNIPARYCTGYLGDIGVPKSAAPMDFSAWFEVYLGDRWHFFDARHNKPRIARILMAKGRDATDVAITTAFGRADLVQFTVVTDELPD